MTERLSKSHEPLTQKDVLQALDKESVAKLTEHGFVNEQGDLLCPIVSGETGYMAEVDDRESFDANFRTDVLAQMPPMNFLQEKPGYKGADEVYSFHGESNDMLRTAIDRSKARGKKFGAVRECFGGAEHMGVKLGLSQALQAGATIDALEINPRAIAVGSANAKLNGVDIRIHQGDIRQGFVNFPENKAPGNTLYVGNAPFALAPSKKAGVELPLCRDGGSNGLEKTMAFIQSALEDSSPGDEVIGVAYTRIDQNGEMEIAKILQELQISGKEFEYDIMLVPGAKLWRGHNGKKEQDNPMSLAQMPVKAAPGTPLAATYAELANDYAEHGWTKLGYVRYCIRITEKEASGTRNTTRDAVHSLLSDTSIEEGRE